MVPPLGPVRLARCLSQTTVVASGALAIRAISGRLRLGQEVDYSLLTTSKLQ